MGAGEIDAMLWCVYTAVAVGNDLGSTPSLRAHSEDFPKHRKSRIFITLETDLNAAANRMASLIRPNESSSNRRDI